MVHIHTVMLSLVVSLVRKRGKNRPTSTPSLSISTFLLYISYSLSCGLNLHTIILCCTPDEQSAKRQQRVNIEKTEVPQHPFLYNCTVSVSLCKSKPVEATTHESPTSHATSQLPPPIPTTPLALLLHHLQSTDEY